MYNTRLCLFLKGYLHPRASEGKNYVINLVFSNRAIAKKI
jgi:hypothetical protein